MKSLFNALLGKNKKDSPKENVVVPDKPNGTIAFADGRFVVTPPKEGGINARLKVDDVRITVLVDGEFIIEATEVTPDSKIEIFFQDKEPKKSLNVQIKPDAMTAYLELVFELGEKVFLSPQGSTDFLFLKADTEVITPEPWNQEEIKLALQQAGVVSGIDQNALIQATNNMPPPILKIAEAIKPISGTDAFIEYLFSIDAVLASVDQNDILAIKHLAVPGKCGFTVTGQTIEVTDGADCDLLVGEGAVLTPDGKKALALCAGRPTIKNGQICVEPQQILDGQVTALKYPNGVVFKGNLIVNSAIEDGLNLEVGGNLLAKNGAVNATLIVGGSVEVNRSLIGTTLYSGRVYLAYEDIIDYTRKLQIQIKALIDNALQLKSKALNEQKELKEEKIINVLLSSRFPNFFDNINLIAENYMVVEKFLEPSILDNLQTIIGCKNIPSKINQLALIYNATVALIKEMKTNHDKDSCSVICHYAQNSRIESSGSINVTGSGCYNSILVSRGIIIIKGTPGIFRGGKAIAKDDITIQELGCPSSAAPTYVEVPADKKITAGLIHAGVVLKVGEKVYRNVHDSRSFELFIDKEGRLQAISLKAELDT